MKLFLSSTALATLGFAVSSHGTATTQSGSDALYSDGHQDDHRRLIYQKIWNYPPQTKITDIVSKI